MTDITDRERRDAYEGLAAVHGEHVTDIIMRMLPHQPADQLVTRTDMNAFGAELRGEMAELRGELRGDMAELRSELRGDMAELRSELRDDMAELRSEQVVIRSELTQLRSETIERFATAKVETQRLMITGMIANVLAIFAAAGLT